MFMAAHSRNGLLIGTLRPCNRRSYRELIYRHFETWSASRECPTPSRKKSVNLTLKEGAELARNLATPEREGDSYVRFTRLADAGASRPRIRDLLKKARSSEDAVHAWLLENVKTLRYTPEDRAPELSPSTLQKRRLLSEILGQRRPWFARPSHRAAIARAAGRSGATPNGQPISGPSTVDSTLVNVYFETEFYSQFAFVIDAVTFTNAEGPMHDHPKCYTSTEVVYPPRLVPPDPPVSQKISIMVYCIIHKHGGLIVGPDIMLTGTKLEKSELPKAQQLAQAGVVTW